MVDRTIKRLGGPQKIIEDFARAYLSATGQMPNPMHFREGRFFHTGSKHGVRVNVIAERTEAYRRTARKMVDQ